jgi:hypothetical protein
MLTLTTVEELRIHVERHPTFGVTDLMAVPVADLRHRHAAEEGEDVLPEPPEVVLMGALGKRSLSDLPTRLRSSQCEAYSCIVTPGAYSPSSGTGSGS